MSGFVPILPGWPRGPRARRVGDPERSRVADDIDPRQTSVMPPSIMTIWPVM